MSKVIIVKGTDRKSNIKRALQLMKNEINTSIKDKKSDTLFIKINAMDMRIPSSCTDPIAVEAVLEFFYDKFDHIIVGDSSYAFSKHPKRNFYTDYLSERFKKVEFSDLKLFRSKRIYFEDIYGHSLEARISLLPKKAFTISLALPKSHDTAIFTGCSKNMVGCLVKGKVLVHGVKNFHERIFLKRTLKSFKPHWRNLVKVIKNARPDLSVMDAFTGMEGDGPLFGNTIRLEIALCSLDPIALDTIASKICGFDNIPYLSMCANAKIGEINNIKIIKRGFKNLKEVSKNFKPHYLFKYYMGSDPNIPNIDKKWFINLLNRYYRIPDKIYDLLLQHIKK